MENAHLHHLCCGSFPFFGVHLAPPYLLISKGRTVQASQNGKGAMIPFENAMGLCEPCRGGTGEGLQGRLLREFAASRRETTA